jgi:DNA mismatch repair protein MutL
MGIQVLPDTLVARIAAGEVVERPASAVKELVENAVDAGAREIRVECAEGGRRLIRVSDDGSGIRADEVLLAFTHHATSKLRAIDDLAHIGTLGFRGEALASIASVSIVTCSTRHADEEVGTLIRVDNGKVVAQERQGRTPGTTMTIEHLFGRVPARLKFLKSTQTERGHIDGIITRYALAYPHIRFTLLHDNRRAFQSLGNGNLHDVLIEVFGADAAAKMIPVGDERQKPDKRRRTNDESEPESFWSSAASTGSGQTDSTGSNQTPSTSSDPVAPSGSEQSDAANTVRDDSPSSFGIRPSSIRVRGYAALPELDHANRSKIYLFVNGRPVQDTRLSFAVIQAYHTLLMTGRYPVAVILVDVPPEDVDVNVHPAKAEVRFRDADGVFSAIQRTVRRALLDSLPVPEPPSVFVDRRLDVSGQTSDVRTQNTEHRAQNAGEASGWQVGGGDAAQHPLSGSEAWDRVGISRSSAPESPTPIPYPPPSTPHAPLPTPHAARPQLPALRIIGQLAATYIIAEGPEGLYLVDQHAAHERILWERMMAAREMGAITSQALLDPVTVDVPSDSAHLLEGELEMLRDLGFEIDHFGGNTFLARSVPAVMVQDDISAALREIVADLEMGQVPLRKDAEARVLRRVCKRMAVKGNHVLSYAEMAALVRDLESCESPRTCPHGRPTMIQIGVSQLEREFGRIV